MNIHPPITGIVLCGGQGLRLGGADKGLALFQGRPLIEHVLARLTPQVDEIVISANRNLDRYGRYGHPVVTDSVGAGPLAGLMAGMLAARHDLVATVPCDAPLLPISLVSWLLSCINEKNTDSSVCVVGGRLQPVFCLARKSALPRLAQALARGDYKAAAWFHDAAQVICDEDAAAFANLNTPDDFSRAASETRMP